jgi:hypothetical protein
MKTGIDKLNTKLEQKNRISQINMQGHILSLSSSAPSKNRRREVESLVDPLLAPQQGYLFRHRRRGHEGTP